MIETVEDMKPSVITLDEGYLSTNSSTDSAPDEENDQSFSLEPPKRKLSLKSKAF